MEEKRKAERPNPDMTIPVAEPRALSGNVFAVEFTELVRPPFPPEPVM